MTLASSSTARPLAVPLVVLVVAGCLIAAAGNGVRTSLGLFTLPMTGDLGISRESWGLAMAIQNLVWGFAQPIAGAVADRYGTARVVAFGLLLYAAGLVAMAFSPNAVILDLTAGVLMGVGIAVSSFSIVMIAFGRSVPQNQRPLIFGVATAASSFGQFIFAPIGQGFINAFGWQSALTYLALILALVVPLTAALRGKAETHATMPPLPFGQALRRAWSYSNYRLLVIGFFVCGFHIAFINVHLPAYLVQQCGLSPDVGSWSIAIIGLFNIMGSLLAGYLGGKFPKQLLLAAIYFSRAVAFGLFMLFPVTPVTAYLFAATIGFLWLSTVPLTAGLVSVFFGPRYMGMLYGVAFFSHQLGSFTGIWMGGYVYDATGSYALVWYVGIVLGLASAAINLPIKELSDHKFQPAAV